MQPFAYERINETTWMYVSTFLILSFFFKFNRAWSIRNLDLFLIILLAPGLLLIQSGRVEHSRFLQQQQAIEQKDPETPKTLQSPIVNQAGFQKSVQDDQESIPPEIPTEVSIETGASSLGFNEPGLARQRFGFFWMFGIGGLIMVRMLVDPLFVRRPVLEPNLSIGGMVFVGLSLLVFVLANVATYSPGEVDIEGARNANKMLKLEASSQTEDVHLLQRGPGYRLLYLLPILSTFENIDEIRESDTEATNQGRYVIAAKSVAITSQILIVLGLILFCHYHFGNFHVGVGIATIYMLLPYTVIFTGNVLHTVPAALLIWALVCYRIPLLSGVFIGLATGVSYYPVFLLSLWISYYWERGWRSFLIGFFISIAVCIGGLFFTSTDSIDFVRQLQAMFAFWFPLMDNLEGVWALGIDQIWRQPLLVGFVLLSVSFALWPSVKDIGTLVAYTAALMAAVQFWHGFGGGLYVAWYLPVALLVMFRPNVAGRVATTEVRKSRRQVAEAA